LFIECIPIHEYEEVGIKNYPFLLAGVLQVTTD